MTAEVQPAVTRWCCSREQLVEALREQFRDDAVVVGQLPLPWLTTLADKILARLPSHTGAYRHDLAEAHLAARDAEIARLKVCITHLNAKIAEKDGQIAMLTKGDT